MLWNASVFVYRSIKLNQTNLIKMFKIVSGVCAIEFYLLNSKIAIFLCATNSCIYSCEKSLVNVISL